MPTDALEKKLRAFARGQECTLRIAGVCSRDPAQTVLAHLGGAGHALKNFGVYGAHACMPCHDYVDGRMRVKDVLWAREVFARGVYKTMQRLDEAGLL